MAFNFDSLLRIFVSSEEDTPPKKDLDTKKKQEEKQKTTKPKTVHQPVVKQNDTTSPNGTFNKKIHESLMLALAKANMPGEDYLEFAKALIAMKNIPLEENVKIQTVLATLSTKGLTVEKVVSSADYYIKILQNEKDKFNIAFENNKTEKLKQKAQTVSELEEAIKKKTEQIALLTEEINKSRDEVVSVKNDIQKDKTKLQTMAGDFNITYSSVVEQIKNNIASIKNFEVKK